MYFGKEFIWQKNVLRFIVVETPTNRFISNWIFTSHFLNVFNCQPVLNCGGDSVVVARVTSTVRRQNMKSMVFDEQSCEQQHR